MNNNVDGINMKRERRINMVALILIMTLVVGGFGATYAFFAASISNSNKISGNANCYTVNYTKGQDITGVLTPGTAYSSGWSTGVVIYTNTGCNNLAGTLYITTNSSSTMNLSDNALKYTVLKGSTVVATGSVNGNANQAIYSNFALGTSSTTYTVYIWLDSASEDFTNLSDESYSGYIHADVKSTSGIKQ